MPKSAYLGHFTRPGVLRRVWTNAGSPTNGAAGTLFNVANKGDLLIDTTNANLYQNTNTQASPTWTQISTGSGNTLDQAYDQGGAGAGKAITVDSGAVALTNNAANNNGVLTLEKTPAGAQSGDLLTLTMGAQASGAALVFANSGSGNDITGSAGWSIQADGDATFLAISLANATLPAGTVAYIGRDNAGDVTINALTGKQVHLAVAGTDVLDVSGTGITVTGNLTVTGTFGISGPWDVGATLTCDELILDTDGVAPAATNVYAVRDNAGDMTVNAVTGKVFHIAIAGSDEYDFSASALDMLGNDLDNAGFVILNTATAPAGTEVYLVHDNSGDLTLNAKAAKDILFAIAGTDEVKFDDAAHIFNEAGNDRDFRVESDNMQFAIYSDGGKDALVLGSNTDTSSVDQLITVSRAARTATAATNYYDLAVQPAGAVTVPAGVTAVVASAMFAEPNITATGTVTDAATLYVSGEPTEGGTGNYAIMAAGSIGLIADAKDLVIGAGRDVLMRWSTADADNHAFAVGLGASLAMHLCQAADIATDWNVAAASNPTLYIHSATTPATEYVALSTDETDAHLNAVGANWSIEIDGTPELTISASVVNLKANTLAGDSASGGNLILSSTSHATKGYVGIATGEIGIKLGGTAARAGAVGDNALHIFNGAAAPAGALANGVSIYSEAGECKVLDATGNSTTLSPHTEDGDYVIHSYSAPKDETVTIHLEKLIAALAQDAKYRKFFVREAGHVKSPKMLV